MTQDLIYFFTYTFMAIFPITNPIGMSPFFLSLTKNYSPIERRAMAKRVAINSFFVYWVTLIAGSWVLKFFNISIPIVKIAGGLLVCLAALGMLQSKPKITDEEQQETLYKKDRDITFFPLTMPITTGAGSLAMAIAIGGNIMDKDRDFVLLRVATRLLGASLGIFVLALTIFICYYFADRIFAKLGKTGTDVVTQVSAFILLAVSIEIIWQGIRTLLLTVIG